jgi:hypothetical protein
MDTAAQNCAYLLPFSKNNKLGWVEVFLQRDEGTRRKRQSQRRAPLQERRDNPEIFRQVLALDPCCSTNALFARLYRFMPLPNQRLLLTKFDIDEPVNVPCQDLPERFG